GTLKILLHYLGLKTLGEGIVKTVGLDQSATELPIPTPIPRSSRHASLMQWALQGQRMAIAFRNGLG
ncbi:MAG: hypothetical protein RBQ67_00510, partial [Candidatus Cloacimonadaceae bacterium]|nr:hypothetical protein [Candidatus Cloacimonadaceae bacterium]